MSNDIQKAVDFLTNDLDVTSNEELELRRITLKGGLSQMKQCAEHALQTYRVAVRVYDALKKEQKRRAKHA